jgi:hypothetical protein
MKRWIRWAARLYPAAWRMRYGGEFDALLDDAGLQWSDLADVVRGAAKARMTTMISYKKVVLLAGLAGAVMAGAIAFSIHNVYVCSASLMLLSPANESGSKLAKTELLQQIAQLTRETFSRDNLIALINSPRLDLYPQERARYPVADIAEGTMRRKIHVIPNGGDGRVQAFRIVFEYPDRVKALAVVDELVDEFQARSRSFSDGASAKLSVLERPLMPETPTYPMRSWIILIGLFVGMAIGPLCLAVWRRTRRYAVVTMTFPEEDKRFLESQVAAGAYRNVDEYIRALIRADELRQK